MFKKILNSMMLVLILLSCATYATEASKPETKPLIQDPQVQTYINELVKKHEFNKTDLEHLFKQVKWQQKIINSIRHPKEGLTWHPYSEFFITHERIQDGVDFWKKNQKLIDKIAKQYGVAPEVIVAILGVETKYGTRQGNYRVIDALSTLAFDYPQRANYFKKELTHYLLVTRENHLNPLSIKGSYAGAFGMPQFMPSSYRNYAVDFNGNGKKDLVKEKGDAVASIANYLKKNGWETNQPVAIKASVSGKQYKKYLYDGKNHKIKKPKHTIATLEKNGITPEQPVSKEDKAILFKLEVAKDEYENWLGFNNLYVIMRYNPSINYAMAVYQLGELIKEQVEPTKTKTKKAKQKAAAKKTKLKKA